MYSFFGREDGFVTALKGGEKKGISGQEVNGPQPYRWPQFSASWVWDDDSFCFYHSKSKVAANSFNVGRLPSKAFCRPSLRRDAAGNRIWKLSSGFLSVCGGGHAYV